MPSLEREADRLRSLIDDADAIIVGIGSGMSSAAGFNHYNRAGMERAGMGDWQQVFGFKSLFDGFYHLYPSFEQQWAFYARYIDFMLREPASRPYLELRSLIGHKDYFILSTNVDTQAEKTFPAERICNYQGSFAPSMQAAMLRRALRRECLRRAYARRHGGVRGSQRGCTSMPTLRLAACAVGARRHVFAGCGMA